jgi:Ca-activated chloride channel family protein
MVWLLEAAIVPLFIGAIPASRTAPAPYAQFTSGVDLVEVYATVTDSRGEPVDGLTPADFQIAEDGARQSISAFAAGTFPLALAVGLDRSFSMGGKAARLPLARSAARALIAALGPGDRAMVVAIGGETTIAAPLSTDRQAVLDAIDRLDVWGTTPLYDATLIAIDAVQPARGRRALVLITDGSDRDSATTAADLLNRARRREVLIYPVAVGGAGPPVLAQLAAVTGGRSFFPRDPAALAAVMTTIARELKSQYLLGYAPSRPRAALETWHAIDVTVVRPGARVRAREGYRSR